MQPQGLHERDPHPVDTRASFSKRIFRFRGQRQGTAVRSFGKLVEIARESGSAQLTEELTKGLMVLDRAFLLSLGTVGGRFVKEPGPDIGTEGHCPGFPFEPCPFLECQAQGEGRRGASLGFGL